MKGLTKRQGEIVTYIEDYLAQKQLSPSYREIRDRFGFSSLGTVYKHVQALKKKGALQSLGSGGRSLTPGSELLAGSSAHSSTEIPFIGVISEHGWIETFPKIQTLAVPHYLVGIEDDSSYLLQVKGHFLREEQICDGDLLVVKAKREIAAGEVVVARVNGSITVVKHHYPEGQLMIRLEGQQQGQQQGQHQPLIIKAARLEIQGVLLGVMRLTGI
jgi:repressor LexA